MRVAQHLKFLDDSVFPLMLELLAACEAAGVPTNEAKQAAAKMQSRHKDFAEASQRQSVEAVTTQSRLTEELTRITNGAPPLRHAERSCGPAQRAARGHVLCRLPRGLPQSLRLIEIGQARPHTREGLALY